MKTLIALSLLLSSLAQATDLKDYEGQYRSRPSGVWAESWARVTTSGTFLYWTRMSNLDEETIVFDCRVNPCLEWDSQAGTRIQEGDSTLLRRNGQINYFNSNIGREFTYSRIRQRN